MEAYLGQPLLGDNPHLESEIRVRMRSSFCSTMKTRVWMLDSLWGEYKDSTTSSTRVRVYRDTGSTSSDVPTSIVVESKHVLSCTQLTDVTQHVCSREKFHGKRWHESMLEWNMTRSERVRYRHPSMSGVGTLYMTVTNTPMTTDVSIDIEFEFHDRSVSSEHESDMASVMQVFSRVSEVLEDPLRSWLWNYRLPEVTSMSRREAMSKGGELMYSPKADGESCLLYTDLSKSTFIWRGSSSSWTLSSQKFGLDPGVLIEAEFMKDGFLVPI